MNHEQNLLDAELFTMNLEQNLLDTELLNMNHEQNLLFPQPQSMRYRLTEGNTSRLIACPAGGRIQTDIVGIVAVDPPSLRTTYILNREVLPALVNPILLDWIEAANV